METWWEARKRAFRHPAVRIVVVVLLLFAVLNIVRGLQAREEQRQGIREAQQFAQQYINRSIEVSDGGTAEASAQ